MGFQTSADCKSAIRQSATLRYFGCGSARLSSSVVELNRSGLFELLFPNELLLEVGGEFVRLDVVADGRAEDFDLAQVASPRRASAQ
jgi:hypothetical protein